jgi:ribose transport system substrate-binding protein
MNSRKTVARIAFVLGLVALSVGIAACGSSNSSTTDTGSTATTGNDAGGVSAAVSETVTKAMVPQKEFTGPTEPVAAESGKKIVAITCSSQGYGCVQGAKGVEEAGKELGWSVTVVDGKGDPSVWNEAIRQAIVTKADGIVLLAVDPKLVADGLSRAKAAGIPVIDTFVPKFPGTAADGYVTTDHVEGGQILADWITQDSGGSAQVLMLNDNEFPELVQRNTALERQLESACPGCSIVESVEFSIGKMAQELGPAVTSALQRNPSIEYVVAPFDSSGIFAAQGIRQAGKTETVKMVSAEGDPNGFEAIRNGEQAVDLATVPPWGGWAAVDLMLRQFAGSPIEESLLPQRLFDESNLPSGEGWEGDVDYKAEFRNLWGL